MYEVVVHRESRKGELKMAEYLNKYPVVLLHGMFGWGQ